MINKILSLIFLVLLLPIFVLISLLIFFEDGFPIIFEQKRIGQNCSFFMILKFRTMKLNTPNVPTHLLENPEQYVLKVGKFLRKYSLDELPNLLNILNGDMVFVGPRPALYSQVDLMELRIAEGIDSLKPGLTGWAQINGRDEISIELKVDLEKEYLNRKSIWFDIIIIWKTFSNVIIGNNISH